MEILCKCIGILFLITIVNCSDCDIIPEGIVKAKNKNDLDRYIIYIQGNPKTYTPNQKYNVSLKVNPNKLPQKAFRQFFLTLDSIGSESTAQAYNPTGQFQFEMNSQIMTRFSDACRSTVVENSKMPKWEIQVYWIAPPTGSGCVAIKATVVETKENWFSEDGQLTKILCEDNEVDENVKPALVDKCCACSEAKYEMAFEGRWTRNTHPRNYPSDIWSTKFSDIIGASHRKYHSFWNEQDYATEGLKDLAESGTTQTIESEIKVMGNNIRTIIKARGLQHPNITDTSYAVFRVDSNNHLVSLVSKITPSPDWFVGVTNFELCKSDCTWAESYTYNLYPLDAGTDDGIGYLSSEPLLYTRKPIMPITQNNPNNPDSPFYDEDGNPMNPIARLHFTRQRLYEKVCDSEEESSSTEENCATTKWGKWTPCSVPCGLGKMTRMRQYLDPRKAQECYVRLVQHQTCQGTAKYCRKNRFKASKHSEENESKNGESEEAKGSEENDTEVANNSKRKKSKGNQSNEEENSEEKKSEEEDSKEQNNSNEVKVSEEQGSEEENSSKNNEESKIEENSHKKNSGEEKDSNENDSNDKDEEETDSKEKDSKEKDSEAEVSDEKDGSKGEGDEEENVSQDEKRSTEQSGSEDIDCSVGEWSEWSSCSAKCGKGTRTRDRKLKKPENEDGCEDVELQENAICRGPQRKCSPENERKCSNTNWGPWSTCSVSCGVGVKRRLRLPPDNKKSKKKVDSEEKGDEDEEEDCSTSEIVKCSIDCSSDIKFGESLIIEQAPDGRVINCKVSEWSIWSKCQITGETCGRGSKKRSRQILRHPENGGRACPRKLFQRRGCTIPCPIINDESQQVSQERPRCIMSGWTSFTPCSSNCGSAAMQLKTRKILYRPPGAVCPARVQYKPCNLPLACASNGEPLYL